MAFTELSIAPGTRLSAPIEDEMWLAASGFVWFLHKFKDATDLMSGSMYPTLSTMIPVFRILIWHVNLVIKRPAAEFNSEHNILFARIVLDKLQEYR